MMSPTRCSIAFVRCWWTVREQPPRPLAGREPRVSIDRALLGRYLRQLADLGIDEICLDGMTAREAVAALTNPGVGAGALSCAESGTAGVPIPIPVPAPLPGTPGAARLQVLGATAAACTLCGLHTSRSTVVFGEGSATADVVVVGEAPGQEEDRTGRPFVGRAGKLLDLMLMSAGFPRAEVYICNVLKCRPPNNRNPLPDEVTPCTTNFLHGQLEAIAPRVLLAVGKFAAQALLDTQESIGRLRGSVHTYRGTPLVVTYHPAYLLRSPQMTRTAWQDFQLVRRVLDEQA
jgi:DNA polymerase